MHSHQDAGGLWTQIWWEMGMPEDTCNKVSLFRADIRDTLRTRVKAHDHCKVRVLIGWKGGDPQSSLDTRRWRPKHPKKSLWMKSVHAFLHGMLWIRMRGLPLRGRPKVNSGKPW